MSHAESLFSLGECPNARARGFFRWFHADLVTARKQECLHLPVTTGSKQTVERSQVELGGDTRVTLCTTGQNSCTGLAKERGNERGMPGCVTIVQNTVVYLIHFSALFFGALIPLPTSANYRNE